MSASKLPPKGVHLQLSNCGNLFAMNLISFLQSLKNLLSLYLAQLKNPESDPIVKVLMCFSPIG